MTTQITNFKRCSENQPQSAPQGLKPAKQQPKQPPNHVRLLRRRPLLLATHDKKAKPRRRRRPRRPSILDQVMAADAKTEARVNQLKEMNAASRKDLGEQAPSSGVAIDWDYIRRKPGSIAARAEAAVRAVDERPSDTGVEVVLGCSSVRRVRVPDADSKPLKVVARRARWLEHRGRAGPGLRFSDSMMMLPKKRRRRGTRY